MFLGPLAKTRISSQPSKCLEGLGLGTDGWKRPAALCPPVPGRMAPATSSKVPRLPILEPLTLESTLQQCGPSCQLASEKAAHLPQVALVTHHPCSSPGSDAVTVPPHCPYIHFNLGVSETKVKISARFRGAAICLAISLRPQANPLSRPTSFPLATSKRQR